MTSNMLDTMREVEVPTKFKINSEDLEVKSEDLKNLEISQKKVNHKVQPQEMLEGLIEKRNSLYFKFSQNEDMKNQLLREFLRD